MLNIPIEPIPNQSLTVNIGEDRWSITLKAANTAVAATISLDDVVLVEGQRIAVGTPILPYEYLQSNGNFLLLVDDEQLPDYTLFGSNQELVYVAPGEI
jgi:hypothetical protein